MKHRQPLRPFLLFLTATLALMVPASAPAKVSSWKDAQGASFRGEPTEILGPFAIFRTSGGGGRRVLLRAFSPEECVRLQKEIAALRPKSTTLATAHGDATGELVGNVLRLQGRELKPADLAGQPEPDLVLVLCGSHNDGEGWYMTTNLIQFYQRVRRVYPGLMEGVFLGTRHDAAQHRDMAIQSWMPWLVAEFRLQGAMPTLNRYIPAEGSNVVLMTRQGVPLVASPVNDVATGRSFLDQSAELLWQIDAANPAGWQDRRHFLTATRPAEYARSHADPLLVGNPLRAEGLRKYGVKRVAARLAVAPDGKVTATLLSAATDVPVALAAPLSAALAQAVAVPAIDQGKPVPGSLDYLLEVPPANPVLDHERTWLASTSYPVLPITDWLVLRPIKVAEQDFASSVIGEKSDGTVILSSFEVNSGKISRAAQMSAFNTDWFAAAGAASVQPQAGDRQKIDDATELTWEIVGSKDGFVDMQTGMPKDYTVGYAWAEFASPRETDAWLGLGSDDGVKIWLNGESVHDQWIRRPSRVDDEVIPVHLKKGANRMLIKIQNATGDWSFVYRLRLKP